MPLELRMLFVRAAVCLACAVAAFAEPTFGCQAVSSATLSGRVVDETGGAVSGATVTITNLDRNQTVSAASDAQGRFRFTFVPAAAYVLKCAQAGFRPFEARLVLQVGQTLDLPIRLTVAGVSQNIVVTTETPVVETVRTQVADTIVPREIDGLPLNGRNYLDLALLAPGVSRTNTGSNQRFAETSAVPGTGISIAGQRNLNNSFVVDGFSANDDAAGLAGTFFGQEVIREFQVVASGGIAELGRGSSGMINIITRSGTNDLRGRLYGFARNQRLDARNPLAASKDPLTQAQYGASLGGPLRRDRTFLFSNFEATRQNRAGFITIAPSSVGVINADLDRGGYGGPRLATGEFTTGYDSTNYFARIDHKLASAHSLGARYSLYDIGSTNARTVGGLNAVSRGTGLDNRDQTLALQEVAELSSRTVHEARFQLTRSRLAAPVNDPVGPAVNISGVAGFGTATFSPTGRSTDLYEAVDTLATQRGPHSLRIGAGVLYNRVRIAFPGALQGVYTFAAQPTFLAGQYITFQQAFGDASQFQSNPNLALFAQDEWRPRADLTVNLGLRYDIQFLPSPIHADADNVAPRLGIAYAPGNHKAVIRASFGLYYDRIPLRATSNALQRDGVKYKVAVLSFGQAGAPSFPGLLPGFPPGFLTGITTIDPHIANSYSEQASLQLERELGPNRSLSVGYLRLTGLHLIMSRNVNVPTLPAAEADRLGVPNLGRPDPRYMNVGRFESVGNAAFDGMTVSFNQRASRWGSMRLAYTLSKSLDNAGNFFFSSPQNNFDLRDDRGLSDNDQRHRLTASGMLEAGTSRTGLGRSLAGWQLSYIFAYTSALPFNIVTGTDRNNDTTVNDRPVGVGRNTGRGFDFASLDLRLSRSFRFRDHSALEVIAEGFNVLNRSNLQIPNNVFGTGVAPRPTFGLPTAAADARQIQLGLRLSF